MALWFNKGFFTADETLVREDGEADFAVISSRPQHPDFVAAASAAAASASAASAQTQAADDVEMATNESQSSSLRSTAGGHIVLREFLISAS